MPNPKEHTRIAEVQPLSWKITLCPGSIGQNHEIEKFHADHDLRDCPNERYTESMEAKRALAHAPGKSIEP